jgi:hypothetical protein
MLKKTLYTLLTGIIFLFFIFEGSDAQTLNIVKNGNLRSGPSTTEKIIGKVTVKQEVIQIEKSGEWYKIKLPNGQVGWANKILISEKPAVKSEGTKVRSEAKPVRKIDISKLGPAAPDNFSPVSGIMLALFKVSSGTHCSIRGDSISTTWYLVLNDDDKLEYSKGKDGPGKPTGKVIYFDKNGGMDPIVGAVNDNKGNTIIPEGKNLILQPHQTGGTYSVWNKKLPGEHGPMAPSHLTNFLGIGTTVRFPPDTWMLFGDQQYRNGGFIITQLSVQFLPLTEVKSKYGIFILYDSRWRKIKSE